MLWAEPEYDRTTTNKAALVLIHPQNFSIEQADAAFAIVGNWRASHSFPLNTFKLGLLRKAKTVDPDALVAQRLKRLSSISDKLLRFDDMKLSQMQDIAGCRAILSSVGHVEDLVKLYKKSDIKHKLIHQDDYIQSPKESGYRGIHLIYRYFSDKKKTYNDLKVEMQFRSALQHAWATAVETVGTFIQQALKSSHGEEDWLRFFALMGTEIANQAVTRPELKETAPVLEYPLDFRPGNWRSERLEEEARAYSHLFVAAIANSPKAA